MMEGCRGGGQSILSDFNGVNGATRLPERRSLLEGDLGGATPSLGRLVDERRLENAAV